MSAISKGRRVSFQFQEDDFVASDRGQQEIQLDEEEIQREEEDPEQELRYRNRSFDGGSDHQMSSDVPLKSVTTCSPNYDSGFDSPVYNIRQLPPSKCYNSKGYKHNLNNNYLNGSFLSPSVATSEEFRDDDPTYNEKRYFIDGLTTGTAISFLITLVVFAAMGFTLLTMFSLNKVNRNGKYESLEFAHQRILARGEQLDVLVITDEDGKPLTGKKAAIQYHFNSLDPDIEAKLEQFEKDWENLMDVPVVVRDGIEIEPRIDYDVLLDDDDVVATEPKIEAPRDIVKSDAGVIKKKIKSKRSPRIENPFRNYYNSQRSGSELFRESYADNRFRESFRGKEPFRRSKRSTSRESFRKY